MQGVLIDDHRIHVDFSQSVGKQSARIMNDADSSYRFLDFLLPGETL